MMVLSGTSARTMAPLPMRTPSPVAASASVTRVIRGGVLTTRVRAVTERGLHFFRGFDIGRKNDTVSVASLRRKVL